MHTERSDRGGVDGLDDADAIAFRCQPDEEFVGVGNDFLDHDLLVVLLAEGSEVVTGEIRVVGLHRLERHDLVGRFRSRPWLGADHSPEPRDPPRPHVVVLAAHRNQKLLRQRDFDDRRLVDRERLEQLRAVSDRLGMLHDYLHRSRLGAISDLNPVARQT